MIPAMLKHTLKTITAFGPDASTFLQGFVTCDVTSLEQKPLLAAACNQKGRIIANFWIWRKNPLALYLQLPESMATSLTDHLKKYVFRAKVSFEFSDEQPPNAPELHPIWILPETTEQVTPQMINLEKHGGVSFTKGCYLGQEIIARTEHLGKLKRHLHELSLEQSADVAVGDAVQNTQGQKIGIVMAVRNKTIFAVLEDRALNTNLTVNNMSLKIHE